LCSGGEEIGISSRNKAMAAVGPNKVSRKAATAAEVKAREVIW